jgi:hypothetical protein
MLQVYLIYMMFLELALLSSSGDWLVVIILTDLFYFKITNSGWTWIQELCQCNDILSPEDESRTSFQNVTYQIYINENVQHIIGIMN